MAAVREYEFPATCRLLRSGDFRHVRATGRRFHSEHFVIFLVERTEGPVRLGITASRKVGGAVQRNRVKRLLREFFRLNRGRFPASVDLSIIAKPGGDILGYRQVERELAFLTALPTRERPCSHGSSSS